MGQKVPPRVNRALMIAVNGGGDKLVAKMLYERGPDGKLTSLEKNIMKRLAYDRLRGARHKFAKQQLLHILRKQKVSHFDQQQPPEGLTPAEKEKWEDKFYLSLKPTRTFEESFAKGNERKHKHSKASCEKRTIKTTTPDGEEPLDYPGSDDEAKKKVAKREE